LLIDSLVQCDSYLQLCLHERMFRKEYCTYFVVSEKGHFVHFHFSDPGVDQTKPC